MTRWSERLVRPVVVAAVAVVAVACSGANPSAQPTVPAVPAPVPAPAPAPAPAPDSAPAPDPLAALPAEVRATRVALLDAARAGDWTALAARMPDDFSSNFGDEPDHVAHYRALDTDVLAELVALLEGPFAIAEDVVVWPDVHLRVPFTVAPDERSGLEERFGPDALASWEAAGQYLGWRAGITVDGTWRFLVTGD